MAEYYLLAKVILKQGNRMETFDKRQDKRDEKRHYGALYRKVKPIYTKRG